MDLEKSFTEFIRTGLYLRGWSQKTVRTYKQGFASFQQSLARCTPSEGVGGAPPIGKAQLETWVISLKEKGLTAGGINMYIRTMNSFCSWLHEQGHEKVRIKLLPNPEKPLRGFSDSELRLLLSFKPKGFLQQRTWSLVMLLIDTGIRIEEALALTWDNVDFDNLIIRVLGKGNKIRLVPISTEGRKVLFRLQQKQKFKFVFSSRNDTRLLYRNAFRDVKTLCKAAGVEGAHVHPHSFRHFFSTSFIRKGGDVYRLSRILGHSSLSTTSLYLRSMGIESLKEGHHSPLC